MKKSLGKSARWVGKRLRERMLRKSVALKKKYGKVRGKILGKLVL